MRPRGATSKHCNLAPPVRPGDVAGRENGVVRDPSGALARTLEQAIFHARELLAASLLASDGDAIAIWLESSESWREGVVRTLASHFGREVIAEFEYAVPRRADARADRRARYRRRQAIRDGIELLDVLHHTQVKQAHDDPRIVVRS